MGDNAPLRSEYDKASGNKIAEGRMYDGRRDGCWIHWYRQGSCRALGVYRSGLEMGLWSYWYPNGRKAAEGAYHDGEENGVWRYWYDCGQLKTQGSYVEGEMDGRWIQYDQDGTALRYEDWRAGRLQRRLQVVP